MTFSKKRKRVLMLAVCRPAAIGGQAACARMLMENFKDVDWFSISFPLPKQYNALLRFIFSCKILFHSILICISRKVDVVHLLTACGRSALFEKLIIGNVLKITGVKVVINFQGAFDNYYALLSKREKWFVKLALRNIDIILCLHNDMKKFLIEQGIAGAEKIRVIPNAVIIEPEIIKVKDEHNSLRLVYLGWIVSNKGLYTLVQAVALLNKKYNAQNFYLDIIGPEVEEGLIDMLQAESHKEGVGHVIRFHPPVYGDGKRNVFSKTDIFVFPTRMEGFPFVLLESMEAGLPVITTNISPMNLIVEHNKNGMLFEMDSSADLARQIFTLMNDDEGRARLGSAARRHIVIGYSVEKIIEMYGKMYEADL